MDLDDFDKEILFEDKYYDSDKIITPRSPRPHKPAMEGEIIKRIRKEKRGAREERKS